MEVAATLFWHHGYRATSTRQIAAAMGLQQASLYHHVTGKEDLLYHICTSSLEHLLRAAQDANAGTADPRARLRALVRSSVGALIEDQKKHATMAVEFRALSDTRRAEVTALIHRHKALVQDAVSAAQTAGVLRNDAPAKYLTLCLLNLLGWLLVWYRPQRPLSPTAVADLFLDIFLDGARANPDGAGPVSQPLFGAHGPALPAVAPADGLSVRPTAERLLDVAAALFRARGYDGTTTREIASVLGVQKPSLYHHTTGKAHLLYQICVDSLVQIRRDVEAALADATSPNDRVQRAIVSHMTSMLDHQDEHTVALFEARRLSGAWHDEVIALRDAHEGLMLEAVQRGQADGVLRDDIPPKYLTLVLMSLTNRTVLWYRPNGGCPPPAIGRFLAQLFLEGAGTRPAVGREAAAFAADSH